MITRWNLTEREKEVMNLRAVECISLKEIAYRMQLSINTVKKHLEHARDKMEARSSDQALLWWMRERVAHEQLCKEVARADELRATYKHCATCNGFGFVPKVPA